MHDPDEVRPHEDSREFRYFGPPGTGKTTTLGRQIHRAAERYEPDKILVTSFSKGAAAEIAGRDLPIPIRQIGTLHAHCYHALGAPQIAEANVEEWNKKYPRYAITPARKKGEESERNTSADAASADAKTNAEEGVFDNEGDRLLAIVNRYRGELTPFGDAWIKEYRDFHLEWTRYKTERTLFDFTDLIELAYRELRFAPGMPSVIFADEAQDLTPMQLRLIRHWGKHTEYFIVAGDDDQILYSFTGCKAEALLNPPLPAECIKVLSQSYRLPRAVHTAAVRWIEHIKDRQPKQYHPREEEGEVIRRAGYDCSMGEQIVSKIIEPHILRGDTVMVLGSCSHMLESTRLILRKEGIPFHNPYRVANGMWNPLRHTKGSACARVESLLAAHPKQEDARRWRKADLRLICEWMTAKTCLREGAKSKLLKMGSEDFGVPVSSYDLVETFNATVLDALLVALEEEPAELAEWWRKGLNGDFKKRAEFPLTVALSRGVSALERTPQVILGTIHSVKGGEADVVVLFPDLSMAGWEQAWSKDGLNATRRLFYVGMTRAKRTLYLLDPATDLQFVNWIQADVPPQPDWWQNRRRF